MKKLIGIRQINSCGYTRGSGRVSVFGIFTENNEREEILLEGDAPAAVITFEVADFSDDAIREGNLLARRS
ncbi:MAG: hypothetical protein Q8N55_00440 [bacterium]|nr:hypothetical protein [bacterium]